MRSYPPAVLAQFEAGEARFCHLIDLGFDTPIRLTDAGHDMVWDGNRYLSTGYVLGLDSPIREADLRVGEINLTLSMVDPAFPALVLSRSPITRPFALRRLFLDDDGGQLHCDLITSGEVTGWADDDKPSAPAIQLSIAGPWADFERVNDWRTTSSSHQRRHPGDNSMKFASKAPEVIWFNGKPGRD